MINQATYAFIFYLCYEMTMLRRWSTTTILTPSYNELGKYAYNSISAFILAARYEEKTNTKINWGFIPKIIIHNLLQKAYIFNDLPKQKVKEIANGKYEEKLEELIRKLQEKAGKEFMDFILDGWYNEDTIEEKIVIAAIKGATIRELDKIYKIQDAIEAANAEKSNDVSEEYKRYLAIRKEKIAEVYENVKNADVIDLFNESIDKNNIYYKILSESSEYLRKQNRFATCPYCLECTILGHLFETGILAYVMALEEGKSPDEAARYFFMGIWHDFPEAYTRDMSSVVKDGFDLRKASEKSEDEAMEKEIYSKTSDYVAEKIKAHMFEGPGNEEYKLLTKGADYFSAFFEIMKQFDFGSRSIVFYEAAKEHKEKVNKKDVSRVSKKADKYVRKTYKLIKKKIGKQIVKF